MNITFTSEIRHSENKQDKIEFTAPVSVRRENNMIVFEFEEPQNKVMNWIEVSKDKANIITGPTTIYLSLHEDLLIEYQTPQGTIWFTSNMSEMSIQDNLVKFSYTLRNKNEILGHYKITLRTS